MAVAIGSKSSGTSTTSGTVTVTKPTGLAAGDMLVAFLTCAMDGAESANWATPTNWTKLEGLSASNDCPLFCFAKVADAGDAAASDFTFTEDTATVDDDGIGLLFRITSSTGFVSPAMNIRNEGSYGTTYTGITAFANSLLLIAGAKEDSADIDFTGWAVTNSNPSWTEEFDANNGSGAVANIGVASATYAGGGATGVYVPGGSASSHAGVILSITEAVNVTVSPNPISMTAAIPAPAVSGGANVSAGVVSLTATVPAPTVTLSVPDWRNTDKSSAGSITNLDKS